MKRWILALMCATAFAGCEEKPAAPKAATPKAPVAALRIAVVPKGTTHDFWKSVIWTLAFL